MQNEVNKIYQRPWGHYQTLALGCGYQVKILNINPGGALSLQKHEHRAEHWTVVQGTPTIIVGDPIATELAAPGKRFFIDKNTLHRAENYQDKTAVIVEVQIGHYLGEDDIFRLHDIYGRCL